MTNNSYQEALLASDRLTAQQKQESSIQYAHKVLATYRDIDNRARFKECTDKQMFLQAAQQRLASLRNETGTLAARIAEPGAR
jgi:prophage DNA circulation protein